MAASAISEGPAMSWQLVQGVPCPRPETAEIGFSSAKPPPPHKRDKADTDIGWMFRDHVSPFPEFYHGLTGGLSR